MYLQPTQDSINATIQRLPKEGGFVMLNLFRLRDEPDYTQFPQLKPETPTTSRALFLKYIAEMDTFLDRYGIRRVFLGSGGSLLIGPEAEHWDIVQLVRYPSMQAFVGLSSDKDVEAHVPLRAVSVEDSRVMAMLEEDVGTVNQGNG
ncbi:MAG: hypothetical protein R3B70_43350 [Polyangiaceae bacterium]